MHDGAHRSRRAQAHTGRWPSSFGLPRHGRAQGARRARPADRSTRSRSTSRSAASPTRSAGASPRRSRWMFEACSADQIERYRAADDARHAARVLRHHRGRGRLRRRRHRRRPRGATATQLRSQRREVARHQRQPRRLLHRPGQDRRRADKRRAPCLFFVDTDDARHRDGAHAGLHPHLPAASSDLPLQRRAGAGRATASAPRATAWASPTPGSATSG